MLKQNSLSWRKISILFMMVYAMAYNGVTFPYSPHVYRNAFFTKESSHIQNVIL